MNKLNDLYFANICLLSLTLLFGCTANEEIVAAPLQNSEKEITIPPYEEDWSFYLATIDSVETSILLDLGLKQILPITDFKYLAFITLDLLQAGENGLGTKEEFEKLLEIESALELSLTPSNNSIYAGRITSNGQRAFYFYVNDTVSFEKISFNAIEEFTEYQFRIGFKKDDDWTIYQNVLYPNAEAMQSIQNSRGVENLANNGDALKSRRKISHWIYFKTETGRIDFENEIKNQGYKTDDLIIDEEDNIFPFVIEISRVDLVNYNTIDGLVLPLFRLAKKHDGDYDGWETSIEKN